MCKKNLGINLNKSRFEITEITVNTLAILFLRNLIYLRMAIYARSHKCDNDY